MRCVGSVCMSCLTGRCAYKHTLLPVRYVVHTLLPVRSTCVYNVYLPGRCVYARLCTLPLPVVSRHGMYVCAVSLSPYREGCLYTQSPPCKIPCCTHMPYLTGRSVCLTPYAMHSVSSYREGCEINQSLTRPRQHPKTPYAPSAAPAPDRPTASIPSL